MATKLYPTKNDLPSNAKQAVIELLNARVADTIDLALITKQAHWNIKGINFIAVHEMLDTLRTEIDGHVDTMAERVIQLGGTALGTVQTTEKKTTLDSYPTDIHTIKDHLAALIDRYGKVANAVRANIDESAEAGDATSADVFTEVSRGLDKALWFLEAHLGA
jgi:starvation-inducible DNA-binding protein